MRDEALPEAHDLVRGYKNAVLGLRYRTPRDVIDEYGAMMQ